MYVRIYQVQERLTKQIATTLFDALQVAYCPFERMCFIRPKIGTNMQAALQPHGVGVVIECVHMCMAMRGVQKPHRYYVCPHTTMCPQITMCPHTTTYLVSSYYMCMAMHGVQKPHRCAYYYLFKRMCFRSP
jgi:GTP cyclohydrolase I